MRLALDDIGYTYGEGTSFAVRALDGVTLSLDRGELVLVLGATGSGKSTLLRVAAGLMPPTEGRVAIDGHALDASRGGGRVGLVFQNPHTQLFAETVEADVGFGPRNLGMSEQEVRGTVREALEAVDLDPDEFGPRSPFALSGGEAHRVAIAGVLAMRPEILLFDEPTAGLDAWGRDAVTGIVASLRAHAGVVVVTHDAEGFLGMADHIVMLADGRPVFTGSREELLADPSCFEQAGLRVPDVLRTQILAEERGIRLGGYTLEVAEAADRIVRGRGAGR